MLKIGLLEFDICQQTRLDLSWVEFCYKINKLSQVQPKFEFAILREVLKHIQWGVDPITHMIVKYMGQRRAFTRETKFNFTKPLIADHR